MFPHLRLPALCGIIASAPMVLAGYDAGASNNIDIYWGQNSINRVAGGQQRLAAYCTDTPVNIIPIAFVTSIKNPTSLNVANAGDNCTTFPGTQLLRCPQIEEDILTCQSLGKTILISLGGATYTENGFTSPSEAETWASNLWAMFGPPSDNTATTTTLRPFGAASVDGIDMAFESPTTANLAPFAAALRRLMDASTASTGRPFYLSAAPQCPFPDAAMGAMLDAVSLDFVSVQFYNNYCGATSFVAGPGGPGSFNLATWDQWARTVSPNRAVKVLVGLPGSPTAAGSGYVGGEQLTALLQYSKGFQSFGGAMVWDMSQVYGNPGFLETVVSGLGGQVSGTTTASSSGSSTTASSGSSTTASPPTTFSTVTSSTIPTGCGAPSGPRVPQWGQCGGREYTGPTECQPPYKCVFVGDWWSHCA